MAVFNGSTLEVASESKANTLGLVRSLGLW